MKLRCTLLMFFLLPSALLAQGFAGLGSAAEGFSMPSRDVALSFPRDHAPHPDFRIEWWYLTANLQDEAGTPYGLQWTLFRSALAPQETEGWTNPQLWMGHAAITTPDAHFVSERLARGGIGQAGVTLTDEFYAWIDDWSMRGTQDLSQLALRASAPEFAYEMSMRAEGPLVLQGEKSYSVKSASGQSSYYYSQPFFDIAGTLRLPQGEIKVSGQAWLDREWSSQPLANDQSGWDWFSLTFDSGARMMGFVLRSNESAPYTSATWITPDGSATALPDGAFTTKALKWSEVAGRDIPTTWELRLPVKGVDVTVSALNTQAWMATSVPYWEGPIEITGTHSGRGYLEMTGY